MGVEVAASEALVMFGEVVQRVRLFHMADPFELALLHTHPRIHNLNRRARDDHGEGSRRSHHTTNDVAAAGNFLEDHHEMDTPQDYRTVPIEEGRTNCRVGSLVVVHRTSYLVEDGIPPWQGRDVVDAPCGGDDQLAKMDCVRRVLVPLVLPKVKAGDPFRAQ